MKITVLGSGGWGTALALVLLAAVLVFVNLPQAKALPHSVPPKSRSIYILPP